MKCGILPISQEALLLGDVSSFGYHGSLGNKEEKVEFQKALGPTAKVLSNQGTPLVTHSLSHGLEQAFNYRLEVMSYYIILYAQLVVCEVIFTCWLVNANELTEVCYTNVLCFAYQLQPEPFCLKLIIFF